MSIVNSPLTPAPLPEDTSKRLIEELIENGVEPLEAEQAVKLAIAQSQSQHTHIKRLQEAMQESLERLHSQMQDSHITSYFIKQSLNEVLHKKNIQLSPQLLEQWIAQLIRFAKLPVE